MSSLALFSASGRWPPRLFAVCVTFIYVASLCSQMLLSLPVLAYFGIFPFVLVQLVLTWLWFGAHARRLRDAGRGTDVAVGIALLDALSIALLLLIMASFVDFPDEAVPDAKSSLLLFRTGTG